VDTSSRKVGETWTLNFSYKVYVLYTVRDFQHVKSSDGFTSLPIEVVLRIFSLGFQPANGSVGKHATTTPSRTTFTNDSSVLVDGVKENIHCLF
jgi:hypothetical protein